jgi:FHA domain
MTRPRQSRVRAALHAALVPLVSLAVLLALVAAPRGASAAPEAHILRIDPRTAVANGAPLLTTVVELVQFNSIATAMQPCANVTGFGPTADCMSGELEKPRAIWSTFNFPADKARLLVKVAGADTLATIEGAPVKWGDSQKEKGVGTAWLIVLDAASGMSSRYGEARAVARQFIEAMQPNDLMNLQIFDDRAVIQHSGWKTFRERNELVGVLNAQPTTAPSHGRDRALFQQLKSMTADAFANIGNTGSPQDIPLHQAMVVLSNGSGRGDAASAAPSATVFHQFVTKGRFPEENTSAPKTPLPVVAIWFPTGGSLVNDAYRNNDQQFMSELANPEIGGFFDIVRDGQGEAKGKTIIGLVKARYNAMYIVKWRLSCLNPSVEQTFELQFPGTQPQMKGDASFKEVPIGVDPTQWPLDVDVAKTKAEAEANPVHPDGTLKVYGNFCWGGDSKRAEAYFIPAGSKPDPNASSADLVAVKNAQKNLIAQNMHSSAVDANDSFVTFKVPDEEAVLEGSGDATVARVLIYDNAAHRASGRDEKTILTLKATKKPFNILMILGIAGGVIVILLLLVVLMRGGGGKGKRSRGPPPSPMGPPGGGYPPPGGGGGYPPPGGGYPPQGGGYPPPGGGGGYPPPGGGYGQSSGAPAGVALPAPASMGGAPAVVQVRCPACQAMTMATPGQASVCFSCGQPLPVGIAAVQQGGGGVEAPTFPLTGGMPVQLQPPANPYVSASGAIISGAPGEFAIRGGDEVRVGRDPAQCRVMLNEPRVSGVHSTLKFEGAQLWVRDETSNNGTYVAGSRIAPGAWVLVPPGAVLRFGPVEFTVRLES